jgi:DNA-binding transcriptional regulator YiaG
MPIIVYYTAMKINKYMKQKRKQLGMTQWQVAYSLNKTTVDICKYERGINEPTGQTLLNFQEVLKKKGLSIL